MIDRRAKARAQNAAGHRPASVPEETSKVGRARRLPRTAWLNAETRAIEGLTLASASLVPVALLLPLWLVFGPPADEGTGVNRFLAACQVGVERGLLGVPGYGAAALLFAWGLFAVVRLLPLAMTNSIRAMSAMRQHARGGTPAELFFEGRVVPFRLLASAEPIAFTAGLLRPRIFLSRGLFASLSREEQNAVLAHEIAHARRRDPLRCFVVQLIFEALFVPASQRWTNRYRALREVKADLSAIAAVDNDSKPLFQALSKVTPLSPFGSAGMNQATVGGIVALRAAAGGVTRAQMLSTMTGFIGLLLLASLAVVGLTDWNSFMFCPLTGSGS